LNLQPCREIAGDKKLGNHPGGSPVDRRKENFSPDLILIHDIGSKIEISLVFDHELDTILPPYGSEESEITHLLRGRAFYIHAHRSEGLERAEVDRSIGLNLKDIAFLPHCTDQWKELLSLQQGFSARDAESPPAQGLYISDNLLFFQVFPPCLGVAGVAPGAPEVTPPQPHERAGIPLTPPLSLNAPEYLNDPHG
jgi:hypothetical protein